LVAGKEIAVKKYAVKLSAEERDRLEALIHAGKSSAQLLTRARILLKAGTSERGEGWSDSAISAELVTSINTIGRLRRRASVLIRSMLERQSPRLARRPILTQGD
jgi:hypothetical protein